MNNNDAPIIYLLHIKENKQKNGNKLISKTEEQGRRPKMCMQKNYKSIFLCLYQRECSKVLFNTHYSFIAICETHMTDYE